MVSERLPSLLNPDKGDGLFGLGGSRELVQERLRYLKVSGIKAFGKPVIHFSQKLDSRITLALFLPQLAQAYGSP